MKNRILLIVGLLLVVVGVVFAQVANFSLADVTAFAIVMFGAGLASADMYNKRDTNKHAWQVIVSIVLIGVGAFLLGFGGFVEKQMTMIITSVFGIVSVIAGVIISFVMPKVEAKV